MKRQDHWERVYSTKPVDRLGWYTPRLKTSLDWTRALGLPDDAPIIDIGSGASTLVDDLLDAGHRDITVLDISEQALAVVQQRLGQKAERIHCICSDITTAELPDHEYALWHDRAVFHFLTAAADRSAYRQTLSNALKPGGYVIIGTFAPEAPPTCSGLPVRRYDSEQLADEFGQGFTLVKHMKEMHVTPGGVEQMYQYCLLRKSD